MPLSSGNFSGTFSQTERICSNNNKTDIMKKLILLSLTALLATGCAQNQLSEKGTVAFDVLQADAMMNTWRYECSQVSSRARQVAETTRDEWWGRNSDKVRSADFGLASNIMGVSDERISTGARMAMGVTWEIQERAVNTVRAKIEDSSDKEGLCLKIMSQYRNGDWDIRGSEEMNEMLASMRNNASAQSADKKVRESMIKASTGVRYGRSFYVVETLARQEGCSEARVSLIKGEWPNEIYNVDCQEKPLLLVRCEWGQCRPFE